MEHVTGVIGIVTGLYVSLIGFKVIIPYKQNGEKMEEKRIWYEENGKKFKVFGILMLLFGIYSLAVSN